MTQESPITEIEPAQRFVVRLPATRETVRFVQWMVRRGVPLLYTAQRRSDVVRMGRQHIKDSVLTVKQQKTGKPLRSADTSR